jgi:hypothetical protein
VDLTVYEPLPRREIYEAVFEVRPEFKLEILRPLDRYNIPVVLIHFFPPKLLLQLDFTDKEEMVKEVKAALASIEGANLEKFVPLKGAQSKSIERVFIGKERAIIFYAKRYDKILDELEKRFGPVAFALLFEQGRTYGHEVYKLYIRKMYKDKTDEELFELFLCNVMAAGRGRLRVLEGKGNRVDVFIEDAPFNRIDPTTIGLITGFLEALREVELKITYSHFDERARTCHVTLESRAKS